MLQLEAGDELDALQSLIAGHANATGSERAKQILANWQEMWPYFVKVMPRDYQRMLDEIAAAERAGYRGAGAMMAAFESDQRKRRPAAV